MSVKSHVPRPPHEGRGSKGQQLSKHVPWSITIWVPFCRFWREWLNLTVNFISHHGYKTKTRLFFPLTISRSSVRPTGLNLCQYHIFRPVTFLKLLCRGKITRVTQRHMFTTRASHSSYFWDYIWGTQQLIQRLFRAVAYQSMPNYCIANIYARECPPTCRKGKISGLATGDSRNDPPPFRDHTDPIQHGV